MTSTERPAQLDDGRIDELERENGQLRFALQSRIAIEQAKGILAERFGTDVDEAFELLRGASRSSHRRIHDVAAEVVSSPRTPPAVRHELARRSR